jgi:glutaredoxin 1
MNIEIYGRPGCGYCVQAKKVCDANQLSYTYLDLQTDPTLKESLQARMPVPLKTVPQIFVDGEYLPGGYTGLVGFVQNLV